MTDTARNPAWVWWVCGALLPASALNSMDRQALANVAPRILAALAAFIPWIPSGPLLPGPAVAGEAVRARAT